MNDGISFSKKAEENANLGKAYITDKISIESLRNDMSVVLLHVLLPISLSACFTTNLEQM